MHGAYRLSGRSKVRRTFFDQKILRVTQGFITTQDQRAITGNQRLTRVIIFVVMGVI